MEKIHSTYWFANDYTDEKGKKQTATVILEIDYRVKNFSIKPYCGPSGIGFTFEMASHKYRMWKAVLIGIGQAIDFANLELGVI